MDCIENGVTGKMTDLGCLPNDPIALVGKFYGFGLSIIGGISLLLLMYGGYVILTSQGNPENLGKGKSYMYYAIGGLMLAIFGYSFIKLIVVNILHIPGFT